MNGMAIETTLSMKDFTEYFESHALGRLYFPNGHCKIPHGQWIENAETTNFFIQLDDLYKLACGWKINHTIVPLDDIIAIIAFGSAVRFPGTEQVPHTNRTYLLFGKKKTTYKTQPIQPEDADFLVITSENILHEEVLKPISVETYDEGTWIKQGGIHLVNRGISQLLKGVRENDTISISALQEGVPIFFDKRFSEISPRTGITQQTPRKILWDRNKEGKLTGIIE